jgi:hypothetical protein
VRPRRPVSATQTDLLQRTTFLDHICAGDARLRAAAFERLARLSRIRSHLNVAAVSSRSTGARGSSHHKKGKSRSTRYDSDRHSRHNRQHRQSLRYHCWLRAASQSASGWIHLSDIGHGGDGRLRQLTLDLFGVLLHSARPVRPWCHVHCSDQFARKAALVSGLVWQTSVRAHSSDRGGDSSTNGRNAKRDRRGPRVRAGSRRGKSCDLFR